MARLAAARAAMAATHGRRARRIRDADAHQPGHRRHRRNPRAGRRIPSSTGSSHCRRFRPHGRQPDRHRRRTYLRVTRGDPRRAATQLAQHYYGDHYQWTRIAAANYGITQPDGKTLRPGETRVYPGWQLRIPTAGMLPTAAPAAASSGTPIVTVADQATTGHLVYTVKHGDWLWFIAGRFLGDPQRYPEIAALNPGLITATQGIHGPDHIEGGWKLILPADAHDRGTHTHAAGTAHANGTAKPPATRPSGGDGVTPGSRAHDTDTECRPFRRCDRSGDVGRSERRDHRRRRAQPEDDDRQTHTVRHAVRW